MTEARKYLKGQLLLDSGQLNGSFFQRTVVLICQHDAEGIKKRFTNPRQKLRGRRL